AAGYVTATPNAEQTTLNMLRLANIYAHQARRRGHDQTIGGVYGEGALSQGIHQSALLAEDAEHENNRITGLPDLSFFVSHADVLLANVVDPMLEPMVGYLKLQHLRDYNNRYGYEKGDALLVKTAELLRRAFPDRYCCHITGGQFCVLCYRDEAEAGLTLVREGQRLLGEKFDVACLAGFAPYTGSESAISLLDRARNAYDSIRSSKKHFMRIYDSKLGEELRFKEYIASHIDEAIESGWLMVYYQPIIRSITSEVCNEEALCRWNDPQYGLLAPGRFIPVLEERGLLYKADLFVVRQVLREFDERRALGVPIVPVSVNLSRRDFEERDMVKEITALLDEAHCDRSLIKIEITESAFVTDQDMLKTEMRRFHAAGFDIWMDDFGSEYSTLNLLRELDFDLIKIDMKFMENFTPDGRNYIIVSKIIDMARELGISTLIEGVETKDQLRMMQILGCEKIQGYLFNSPHPLSYIAQRAQTGTGLHFEKTASAPYYGMVGRVNLNEPMASADGKKHLLAADVMPAGVVELRDGRVFCLRGTNAFLRRLEQWKILSAAEDDTQIREVTLPSKKWQEMMEQGVETEEWVSMTTKTSFGRSVVIYVRRLGDASWQGALAMLVVLLPEVEL
ncbi:MAG: bifunctional diguanylate cyclase/phosphodiesterase, partial [Oscillospiraceae bacterium]|nr:bifunctional diguanylate cyclase/phosphodiesterase [Oscillospiraceae bacterium]